MSSGNRLRVAASVLVIVAAVVTTGRTAVDLAARASRQQTQPRQVVADWRQHATEGHLEGPPDAAVTIVVFWDFECATCASLSKRIAPLLRRYPADLAVRYRPLPLAYHEKGAAAAIAGECAAEQGRYLPFHRRVLDFGDSLPSGDWGPVAYEAGVRDLDAFVRCVRDPQAPESLRLHSEAAATLGVLETPTMLIRGDLYTGIPWDFEALVQRHVRKAVAARASR